jgi:spore maturation protein B
MARGGPMSFSIMASTTSSYMLLGVIVAIPCVGALKRVAVFESFLEGASDALKITFKLMPYLVGMIVAVGMLRDSGAIDLIADYIGPSLEMLGLSKELLPLALLRPFSGAASNAMMFDLINQFGPDSLIALTSATIMGATETTFYLVAVLFGAVNISRTRHAIAASLIGELCGIVAAVYFCRLLLA